MAGEDPTPGSAAGAPDRSDGAPADGPDNGAAGDSGNPLETRWRDLGDFIREQRRVGQLSLRKLSERAGVSNPYLSQIERGLRKPSAEILRQIARALEISSEDLYVRAGILDERFGERDLIVEIRRDPHITEHEKKTLIHIYETFRQEQADSVETNGAPVDGAGGDPEASA